MCALTSAPGLLQSLWGGRSQATDGQPGTMDSLLALLALAAPLARRLGLLIVPLLEAAGCRQAGRHAQSRPCECRSPWAALSS